MSWLITLAQMINNTSTNEAHYIAGKNNIVADALSRLEKDEVERLSETEEGIVLSHDMCAVAQNEARVMPESKEDLVHNIMNFDEIESE
jgi:hypothetical protein